jgi:hypothetical protein
LTKEQLTFTALTPGARRCFPPGSRPNPSSAIAGHRIFDKGQCIDALRHVQRELGNVPTLNQYEAIARESNGALPSGATIRNRCRSWGEALRLAGIA